MNTVDEDKLDAPMRTDQCHCKAISHSLSEVMATGKGS